MYKVNIDGSKRDRTFKFATRREAMAYAASNIAYLISVQCPHDSIIADKQHGQLIDYQFCC